MNYIIRLVRNFTRKSAITQFFTYKVTLPIDLVRDLKWEPKDVLNCTRHEDGIFIWKPKSYRSEGKEVKRNDTK